MSPRLQPLPDFENLLHPVTSSQFMEDYLGKNFLHVPGTRGRFEALFPWPALNRILTTQRFGAKGIRLVKGGRAVAQDAFLKDGIVRAAELTELLRDGATVVLERVDCMYPPLTGFAEGLERVFETPVQINMYAGWRLSHGFNVHWDDHDVIVLQIAGRKHWKVYGVTEKFPVKNSVELGCAPPESDPVWDRMLDDGDLLYLPRGWWHIAIPCDEPTMHLTVGLRYPNGLDLARWVMQDLERDEAMRMDLAATGDAVVREECLRRVRESVARAFAPPDLLDRFLKSQRDMASPRPQLGLPWSATPQIVPDSEDSLIKVASPRGLELEVQDGYAVNVVFSGKVLTFAAPARPLVEFLAQSSPVSIRRFYNHFEAEYDRESLREFLADLARHGVIVLEG